MIRYAKRASLFEKREQVWQIQPDALVWSRPDGSILRLPWSEVASVRLGFDPPKGRRLILTSRRGGRWTIDSQSFVGLGRFEDRLISFAPFAVACVERVAALAPHARAHLGSAPASYWGQLLMVGVPMVVFAWVLILLPTEHSGAFWLKAWVTVLSLPLLFHWIAGNRPRRVALDPELFRAALT